MYEAPGSMVKPPLSRSPERKRNGRDPRPIGAEPVRAARFDIGHPKLTARPHQKLRGHSTRSELARTVAHDSESEPEGTIPVERSNGLEQVVDNVDGTVFANIDVGDLAKLVRSRSVEEPDREVLLHRPAGFFGPNAGLRVLDDPYACAIPNDTVPRPLFPESTTVSLTGSQRDKNVGA